MSQDQIRAAFGEAAERLGQWPHAGAARGVAEHEVTPPAAGVYLRTYVMPAATMAGRRRRSPAVPRRVPGERGDADRRRVAKLGAGCGGA